MFQPSVRHVVCPLGTREKDPHGWPFQPSPAPEVPTHPPKHWVMLAIAPTKMLI